MASELRRTSIVVAIVALCALGLPRSGHAEPSTSEKAAARTLMDEGHARRAKGDHKGALESFRAAHAIMKLPRTGVEVGRSLKDLALLIEAEKMLREVMEMPVLPDEPPPSAAARAEAKVLADDVAKRIPTLRLVVTGDEGQPLEITLDGEAAPSLAKSARRLNPGAHALVVRAGKREQKTSVTLGEGEHKELAIDLTLPPDSTPPKAPPKKDVLPPSSETRTSPLVYVGFITAAVGITTGAVTGLLAFSKTHVAKAGCERTDCPPPTHADLDAALLYGNVSTVAFVVGGLGAGLGVVGLIAGGGSRESTARPSITPMIGLGSFGLRGRF